MRVPYTKIQGLPPEAQNEIQRNFEEIENNFVIPPTMVDAIVDSTLVANDPGNHLWKTVGALVLGDTKYLSFSISSSRPFVIGMRSDMGTPVAETAGVSLTADTCIISLADRGPFDSPSSTHGSRPVWDMKGFQLQGATGGERLELRGISFQSQSASAAVAGLFKQLHVRLFDSEVWCDRTIGDSAAGANCVQVFSSAAECFDTQFVGVTEFGGATGGGDRLYFENCSNVLDRAQSFAGRIVWNGGRWQWAVNVDITLKGDFNKFFRFVIADASAFYGTVAAAYKIIVDSTQTQPVTLVCEAPNNTNPPGLSVIAGASDVYVQGQWRAVTMAGTNKKVFVGSTTNAVDITGPAHLSIRADTSSAPSFNVKLRGVGVTGHLSLIGPNDGVNAQLALVDCDDAVLLAEFKSGSQAYTIDASSARNLLMVGGIGAASYTAPSVDSGTTNTVVTYLGSPPTGAAGGDLTGAYPNPTIGTNKVTNAQLAQGAANTLKGNNTGSTANEVDLTVAQVKTLLAFIASGDAAGGDLSGTYPNPLIDLLTRAAAGTVALRMRVTADTQNRFQIAADGTQQWGTGGASPDTNLYRNGVDQLRTDDGFMAGGLCAGNITPIAGAVQATGDVVANIFGNSVRFGTSNTFTVEMGDTRFYRSAADVLATDDDFAIDLAGKGFKVKEGTNAKMGVATLVGGTVVVSTTKVGANTRIFLTIQSLGTVAAPKAIAVTARTAATSFTITSADATDTSVVAWQLVEPA